MCFHSKALTRHDEERRYQQNAHNVAAGEGLLDQQGDGDASDYCDQDHAQQQQRIHDCRAERRISDEVSKFSTDETNLIGLHQL